MLSFWVVEKFDIIKHILTSILAGCVGFSPDPLSFQKLEKAFGNSIIITRPSAPSETSFPGAISSMAHAGFQVVSLQEFLPLMTGKLATLVGMNDDL